MKFYPTADGTELREPDASAPNDRIRLAFLSVHCQINRYSAQLLRIKRNRTLSAKSRRMKEQALRAKLETALRGRDQLEDRYAPYGLIAEAVLENGFTVDVRFSFGGERSALNRTGSDFVSSAYISIPLPSSLPKGKLKVPEY